MKETTGTVSRSRIGVDEILIRAHGDSLIPTASAVACSTSTSCSGIPKKKRD
ncbi:MAG: hypothetical protein ACR2KJ_04295 [Jatrophihabitans sp.]